MSANRSVTVRLPEKLYFELEIRASLNNIKTATYIRNLLLGVEKDGASNGRTMNENILILNNIAENLALKLENVQELTKALESKNESREVEVSNALMEALFILRQVAKPEIATRAKDLLEQNHIKPFNLGK